jgi:hypothetical protein
MDVSGCTEGRRLFLGRRGGRTCRGWGQRGELAARSTKSWRVGLLRVHLVAPTPLTNAARALALPRGFRGRVAHRFRRPPRRDFCFRKIGGSCVELQAIPLASKTKKLVVEGGGTCEQRGHVDLPVSGNLSPRWSRDWGQRGELAQATLPASERPSREFSSLSPGPAGSAALRRKRRSLQSRSPLVERSSVGHTFNDARQSDRHWKPAP